MMAGRPEFEFLSGWGWTGQQTYYYLSIIFYIVPFVFTSLCSVFIIDSEASNIWSGQIWLLGTQAFIADRSIFKCGLTPFRWSLLNILTVCCTSLSVVHCLPKSEQPVIDHWSQPWPGLVTRFILRKQVQPILAPCCVEAPDTSPYSSSSTLIWRLKYVKGLYFMTLCLCSNVSDRTISWNHASERHHLLL